jgi:hypothetical protein
MRPLIISALVATALLGPAIPAEAVTDPPTLTVFSSANAAATRVSESLSDPVDSAVVNAGGVRIGAYTVVPPAGASFDTVGTFEVAAAADASHGTVSSNTVCSAPVGTVTVREAVGSALALDFRVSCGTNRYAGALRRTSNVPYAFAYLTNDAPPTIPYSGGTFTMTLHNRGSVDLVPGVTTPTSANAGSQTIVVDGCNGVTVGPGATCDVTVHVVPDPADPRETFVLATDVPALGLGGLASGVRYTGGTAPTAARGLAVTGSALGNVALAWSAPTDDGGNAVRYEVYRPGGLWVGTTAALSLVDHTPGQGASRSYYVVARGVAGAAPASSSVTGVTGSEALVVERPDGIVYAADPARPSEWVRTLLFPGGADVRDGWIGNSGSSIAQMGLDNMFQPPSSAKAAHDFAGTRYSPVLYARAGSNGIDNVYTTFVQSANPERLVVTAATQPTEDRDLRFLFAVPAGKTGPTGGNLLSVDVDGKAKQVAGTAGALHPALSPDARWLAYVQPDGHGTQLLRLRTVAGASTTLTSSVDLASVTSLRWRSDGRLLYVFDQATKTLHTVAVDPVTGPTTVTTLLTGDVAGPAQWASPAIFDVTQSDPETVRWYMRAGASYACAVDGVTVVGGCASPFHATLRPGTHTIAVTQSVPGLQPAANAVETRKTRTQRDFDGNGTADFVVFRPSNGTWHLRGKPVVSFGRRGDVPLVADFNGDGAADIAVYRPASSTFYVKGVPPVTYGHPGDVAVPGDYNGDGKDDIAVFRPSTGYWYVRGQNSIKYGQRGDQPLPGYWASREPLVVPAFCRPSTRQFQALRGETLYCPSSDAVQAYTVEIGPGATRLVLRQGILFFGDAFQGDFGHPTDVPVLGDYTGDGAADLTLFRPETGQWLTRGHSIVVWGQRGDVPL